MPIPTIPTLGQVLSKGFNNIKNVFKASKDKYNALSQEQKAELARDRDRYIHTNVLPKIISVAEFVPGANIGASAYLASNTNNPEEKFQHMMTPIIIGTIGRGTKAAVKAAEKGIDAAGKAIKTADNTLTIRNALRTSKLRSGEPNSGYMGLDALSGYKKLRKQIADKLKLEFKYPKVTDNPEYQKAWYNNIVESHPNIKIDNRFITETKLLETEKAWQRAIEAGDMEGAQRMRDLHFKLKAEGNRLVDAEGNPHKVWHGSPEDWNIFDDYKRHVDDVIYFSTDKSYADQYTIPRIY